MAKVIVDQLDPDLRRDDSLMSPYIDESRLTSTVIPTQVGI